MSFNVTFKNYNEVINYLNSVDYPQCFTVNYKPKENNYELWIGNQPYYIYEKWIEEEEQKVKNLKKENLILKGEIVDLQRQLKEIKNDQF